MVPGVEDLDRLIVRLLAADGRRSYTDLARDTGLSVSALHQRVRRPWVAGFVLPPPLLTLVRQRRDRVVVRIATCQGVSVVVFDAGAVVLRPVGDAAHSVVVLELVDPTLADVGNVADHPRRREA